MFSFLSLYLLFSAVGDSVKEDEVIGEIETDKTSIPINSPASGVIEALLVEDGTTVKPGMDILKLRRGPGGSTSPKKDEPKEAPRVKQPEQTAAAAASPPPPPPPPASQSVPQKKAAVAASSSPPQTTTSESIFDSGRGEQRVKMNRMRQRIAQRLKDAQNQYAMLTTFNEIDMT